MFIKKNILHSRKIVCINFVLLYFIASFSTLTAKESHNLKISVIGTGYVGLVLGAGLSEWGYDVVCVDILEEKIQLLQKGEVPFFEPGLDQLVLSNIAKNRLCFTTDIAHAIRISDIVFVAVGTPSNKDGSADISALEAVAKTIGQNINNHKIICVKSTVPIGTTRKIKKIIADNIDSQNHHDFNITFIPEFLREGSALTDFFNSDRFVVGADDAYAIDTIKEIFNPLLVNNTPFVETNLETAEAIKYASNAFLATKISFINEFANLCDVTGADVSIVAYGMGLDNRIGPAFLKPGPGYGGSCFPKDTLGLLYQSSELGVSLRVVEAAVEANHYQMVNVVNKIKKLVGNNLAGIHIAVLGLAFKANTDDVRSSPAISVIGQLLAEGALVSAYDPMAIENMKKILPNVSYLNSIEKTVVGADVTVVLTDWDEIKNIDLIYLKTIVKQPILIDARNLYEPDELYRLGYQFDNMGRPLNISK